MVYKRLGGILFLLYTHTLQFLKALKKLKPVESMEEG
jgi:hypothetical protein